MYSKDTFNLWHSGQGHWRSVPVSDWNDWTWQLRNRLNHKDDISKYLSLSEDESDGLDIAKDKLLVSITPHFFNLIDPSNPHCPIRKQVIPSKAEKIFLDHEDIDPVGEEGSMVTPGLVHRYPDRVLFLVTDRCGSYCRYCTRSRLVSNAQGYGFHPNFEQNLAYIRNHEEIRDVLISGGDPLLLSDNKLSMLLQELADISHVEFVRLGSRLPVFLPQRITPNLLNSLKSHPNLWMSIHVNHPHECTLELKDACHRLANSGIPLGNQSVLLKGINDNVETMKSLIHRLLMMKVRPYYLYQCDLVPGSSHLRTPVSRGIEIIEGLRGSTTGYAIPQFVIDAPGGGGKIPLNPDYVEGVDDNVWTLRNFEGKQFTYHSVKA
ncbi:MAG: KamA family radical SAM protein [Opitutae bacterium]